ncbi:hypothetical protein ADUPG1_010691, partial [Aduncisulcus paluster]
MLLSMFSTVPSLVLHISPRYDANMVWCKNNGAYNEDYSRYIGNCNPSLKKWHVLIDRIKSLPNRESTSKLYYEHVPQIYSLFHAYQSTDEIKEHRYEIILCIQCLRWFVRHDISENIVFLPIPDLNDLIDTFIDHLSRCEEVLDGVVDEEYCMICINYSGLVQDKRDSFLPKISPTFQRILERGNKKRLGGDVALGLLNTLRNISCSPSSSTRSSIFTLIKPYIRDWLRIYNDSKCYGNWMFILSKITFTLSSDYSTPNKSICSDVWPLFHPVLNVVKREFVGDKIVEDNCEEVLWFFSNLCCDPSHAVEIYDNVKDLLDGWFMVIKKEKHKWGIVYWFRLISMFSPVSSLVPRISPKYDTKMKWCFQNGGLNGDYTRYLENCNLILRFLKLIERIKKCHDIKTISKLYMERRNEILSVFIAYQTNNNEIKEHKREIILCTQCLKLFVQHFISGNNIYLSIPDLNDLIDTFIDHLSRCEKVLDGDVDEEYCDICMCYTSRVEDKWDSFLPKISPTFQRILERGSKKKLGGNVARDLLNTICNISNFRSFSTRSSILTLIKPYIRDWLRIYNNSKCYGRLMIILSKITLSSDNSIHEKSLCSEAWPLFHPVLDVVKKEFVGDKIVEDMQEHVLFFFSNLCCDSSHAVEIYDNVNDLLDVWFEVIKRKHHEWGSKYWSMLLSMFS